MPEQPPGFFIAPFGIDGESEGLSYWEFEKLSGKWLVICAQYLTHHGTSFDTPLDGHLSHIQMKFTGGLGIAFLTFSVHGRPAASVALASGLSLAAELEVMKLFVDSLRRVQLIGAAAASSEPLQKALMIKERPVMIVVPWPDSAIVQQDQALVRELAVHMAGAFFQTQ